MMIEEMKFLIQKKGIKDMEESENELVDGKK